MMRTDTQLINRALELVRDGLRSGSIPADNFSMSQWGTLYRQQDCRSVHCIGGWVFAIFMNADLNELAKRILPAFLLSGRLLNLFYPPDWRTRDYTTTEGADAIDRYLDGKEPWPA